MNFGDEYIFRDVWQHLQIFLLVVISNLSFLFWDFSYKLAVEKSSLNHGLQTNLDQTYYSVTSVVEFKGAEVQYVKLQVLTHLVQKDMEAFSDQNSQLYGIRAVCSQRPIVMQWQTCSDSTQGVANAGQCRPALCAS